MLLLTINLTHGYYSDGRCPDFDIALCAQTARLLQNHRCVTKPRADDVNIHVPLKEGGETNP